MKNHLNAQIHYLLECILVLTDEAQGAQQTVDDILDQYSVEADHRKETERLIAPIFKVREAVVRKAEAGPRLLEKYFAIVEPSIGAGLVQGLFHPYSGTTVQEILDKYARMDKAERQSLVTNFICNFFLLPEGECPPAQPRDMQQVLETITHAPLEDRAKLDMLAVCLDVDGAIEECGAVLLRAADAMQRRQDKLAPALNSGLADIRAKLAGGGEPLMREFIRLPQNSDETIEIYPLLLKPTSGICEALDTPPPFARHLYMEVYGVYHGLLRGLREQAADWEQKVGATLRLLGDKTKRQILHALRQRPMYGQELADITGLTTATISYHMGLLVSERLVQIEKEAVKVYYHLNKDELRQQMEMVERYFGVD